ncbi:HGGxSTG domain-containing protein [Belnapia arida]|uniref:HGGxSTG domain-containing protein n=1 Tax=Belnapia arida TaxID=2804533 RepID=UPI002E2C9098|nr:HGGxSTG domain-containing protein [Belnapia arida]
MSNQPHATCTCLSRLTQARLAPSCGAKTRRCTPCAGPAMLNGRCRMHGGKAKGQTTPAGRERSRAARLVHGLRAAEARQAARERGAARREMAALSALLRELEDLEEGSASP